MNSNVSSQKTMISVPVFLGAMVGVAAASILSVYLMDPELGEMRRSRIRDRMNRMGRDVKDRADQFTRRAVDEAKNFVSEAKEALHPDAEETLVDRKLEVADQEELIGESASGSIEEEPMVPETPDEEGRRNEYPPSQLHS